ncbi:MAG: hypothetical protein SGPRY_011995, partial [Prymnesium sp.]
MQLIAQVHRLCAVDGKVEPISDAEALNLELLLADLSHVERRLEKTTCKGEERMALETVASALNQGIPARAAQLSKASARAIKSMGLLTLKPMLYAFNVDEIDFSLGRTEAEARAEEILGSIQFCDPSTVMYALLSARTEAELSLKSASEKQEYLDSVGLELRPGQLVEELFSWSILPSMAQRLLGLSLVYTGPGVAPE